MFGDQNTSEVITVYVSNNCQAVRSGPRSHIDKADGRLTDKLWGIAQSETQHTHCFVGSLSEYFDLYYFSFFSSLDYIVQVMAESEETGLTHIDPGTALSIELSNTLPQQILLAARKRKQQQSREEGGGSISKLRRSSTQPSTGGVTTTTNVFGDSEDEGGSNDGQEEDNEDNVFNEDNDADVTAGGVLDLFKFRVSKKQASN